MRTVLALFIMAIFHAKICMFFSILSLNQNKISVFLNSKHLSQNEYYHIKTDSDYEVALHKHCS